MSRASDESQYKVQYKHKEDDEWRKEWEGGKSTWDELRDKVRECCEENGERTGRVKAEININLMLDDESFGDGNEEERDEDYEPPKKKRYYSITSGKGFNKEDVKRYETDKDFKLLVKIVFTEEKYWNTINRHTTAPQVIQNIAKRSRRNLNTCILSTSRGRGIPPKTDALMDYFDMDDLEGGKACLRITVPEIVKNHKSELFKPE